MSELIPSISITEFKKLNVRQIKRLKSVEITSDGSWLFTVLIPHGDVVADGYIQVNAERLAMKSNIVGGLELEEIMNPVPVG